MGTVNRKLEPITRKVLQQEMALEEREHFLNERLLDAHYARESKFAKLELARLQQADRSE